MTFRMATYQFHTHIDAKKFNFHHFEKTIYQLTILSTFNSANGEEAKAEFGFIGKWHHGSESFGNLWNIA